ncbi:TonB-dependent receptor [Mucilaginibacter sp. CSA2-8R]|uniref:TonB-dependent receptor n=1 Tax=Mucilaginibacter sp. CSA2-8R TaxID=3141542 RepID=UPI00315CB315
MNKLLQTFLLLTLSIFAAQATTIKGHVYDSKTGEPLTGATISLDKTNKATSSGLDGSFKIDDVKPGHYTLRVSYISYKTTSLEIEATKEKDDYHHLKFYLEPAGKDLAVVSVMSKQVRGSEREARRLEQVSVPIANIVSARAIEVSPDLTVANVIQRVSGVSVERNSNGDAQYAILRGMDKRYNYTLVNGVKIPSPDNQYRYVPLDIFPADILERLEVYKSLTPNMEGDAIGGAVNMVMKSAPDRLQVTANVATGYNQLFFDRKFMSYDYGSINHKSPYEINGRAYQAKPSDFHKGVFNYSLKNPAPNLVGNLSIGQRFLDSKLGIIVSGSYQNTYRGSNSTLYSSSVSGTDAYATITSKSDRKYSEQQKRYGLNANADYVFNTHNKISLYNFYARLDNIQVRDAVSTAYNGVYNPQAGNAELTYSTRSRLTEQQIYNSTLQGDHKLFDDHFKIHWSGVYSSAKNDVPDNTTISVNGLRQNNVDSRTVLVTTAPVTRRWERNTDEDKAGYLDLTYTANIGGSPVDFSAGGLYRDKQRSNFFNNYTFAPVTATDRYGVNFQSYTDVALSVTNPGGGVNNPLTYDASEKVGAGYGMVKFAINKLQVTGGARVEHTNQGYNMLFPAGELRPNGKQVYTDVLPSLNLKYLLNNNTQLHASYYRALNRPGFYELIPGGIANEDYKEKGNPDLKRAIADNYDLRYELFSPTAGQLFLGGFYKRIQNPIEYTFQADATRGQDTYYTPGNFGTAHNFGAELDYIKYFNKVGVKANYTYTNSRITTPKTARRINSANGNIEAYLVDQTRPLFGQSAHIANVSLLYRDVKKGWDAQLAAAYTGERINTISQFLNNDLWQKAFIQMDASAEKRLKHGITIFVKANNLLNTPTKLLIKGTNPANNNIAENLVSNGQTLIRNDYYKQSYLIGLRYKL